jgi:hypothetical protein
VLWRLQIQADNISRFAFKVRVGAGHVALQPMRSHAPFLPNSMHQILADSQIRRQLSATLVRRAIVRLPPSGSLDFSPQRRREFERCLPRVTGVDFHFGSALSSG